MMESSCVMEVVAEVALESGILCLGVFFFYIIGSSNLTFIRILCGL